MKIIYFILIISLLGKSSFSQQNYFLNTYDHHLSGAEAGTSLLSTDSGCIILFGTTDTIGFHAGLLKTGLLFLSDSGTTQFERIYTYPNNFLFPGGYGTLRRVNQDQLIFSGSSQNQSNPGNTVLTKFDNHQNILWQQTYGDTNFQSGWKCQQTRDGGFIIIGQNGVDYSDSSDVLLIKTDSLGNFQWQKLFGGFRIQTGLAIDTCIDGGFILTCGTLSYGVGAGSGFGNGYVIKTDSTGSLEWSRTFGGIYDDGFWNGITLHDGTYLFCGYYTFYDPYYPITCCASESKLYLVHLDLNGNTIWEKNYDRIRPFNLLYSVKELPDGNLIAAGWFNDTLTAKVQGVLLKLNSNGDTIWTHKYDYYHGMHSVNVFYDVVQVNDGGFVATGFINPGYPDSSNTGEDIWVIKVDSNGCEMANCLVNAIGEVMNKENNLIVFPNPVSSAVNFQLNDAEDQIEKITLFNSMGQKIKFQNQTEINMNEYSTGIYFYSVYTRKKLNYSGKFIKQ